MGLRATELPAGLVQPGLPPRFEVWLEVQEGRTASGQRYILYGEVRRFGERGAAERCARENAGLVLDLETGEVERPIAVTGA
jgi:hypothetical protein